MTTPLFSYVTVRNPRRPTASEIASGFIRYDPALGGEAAEQIEPEHRPGKDAVA